MVLWVPAGLVAGFTVGSARAVPGPGGTGAGARCRSVRRDDTRGHEICWNPFVGDGEEGCKAALDPPSTYTVPLPADFVGIGALKPRGLPPGNSSCGEGRTRLSGRRSAGSLRPQPWEQQE